VKRDIQDKVFRFASEIVRLHKDLVSERTARVLGDQLLRSATSIGANLEEACAGQSKPDFISKCSIALNEARETLYWLKLLLETRIVIKERLGLLVNEADELVAIITTIVRNTRGTPK